MDKNLYEYCIRLGDNGLILSHRLAEYSSNGPFLEEDLAITNVGLDLLGQAESFLKYAAEIGGTTEDALAFKRPEQDYKCVHMVEFPNKDFAYIMARQYFMDVFNYELYTRLKNSSDQIIAAIAAKSLKEVTYHKRRSTEWMYRLGEGTEESNQRLQAAVDELWKYTDELFLMDEIEKTALEKGYGVDLAVIKSVWESTVKEVFAEAGITYPTQPVHSLMYGKQGFHTEYFGFLLTDMQYLNLLYPDATW